MSESVPFRLAVDIGGTFTDVVLQYDDGARPIHKQDNKQGDQRRLFTTKVLTSHAEPAQAVVAGITQLLVETGAEASACRLVLHGTTLATNALIERRGATTALLTTAGHIDTLEMAFENRFEQYDINIDRPAPLVPRYLRLPVVERMAADGVPLLDLSRQSVLDACEQLEQAAVTSVAIGLFHAYANADHELKVAAILRERLPQLTLSLSSQVCPEIREYERLSTTTANAYVKPMMEQYLTHLVESIAALGFTCDTLLMTSGGGLTSVENACAFPIRLVESGPAGGAVLAANLARQSEIARLLSFDMGGTTAKICLIDDGEPQISRTFEVDRRYRFKKGSGLPVRVPVIEMVEIGAGGGSITTVDKLKRVAVGPASAGSEPGPACYDLGGRAATVTDADVQLGKIRPHDFAGGDIQLSSEAASDAIANAVATPLAVDLNAGAIHIAEIVDENMAAAARAHALEWGKDLAHRTLVAFGGAAPLHATSLANKLKIKRVMVPASAGVGSALGFLLAPVRYEVVRSHYMKLDQLDLVQIDKLFQEMQQEAEAVLATATAAATATATAAAGTQAVDQQRRAYMRYAGQGYEVGVTLPSAELLADSAQLLLAEFETVYKQLYGRVIPGLEIEVMSWTLSLTAPSPITRSAVEGLSTDGERLEQLVEHADRVSVYDSFSRLFTSTPVLYRNQLPKNAAFSGPALIVEAQTTTVVTSNFAVYVQPDGGLLLTSQDSHITGSSEGDNID